MDILDGIAKMRCAFSAANMKPPATILLESHEEGMRFLAEMRQQSNWLATVGDPSLGKPIEMADGSVWMEVKVLGVAVRWPATLYAMPDGSWRHA